MGTPMTDACLQAGAGATAATLPRDRKPLLEIRPHRGLLDLDLPSVWRHHELLQFLVLRELKVRYKQAALGAAWAVVQPLLAALIFTVVFGIFARLPSDGLPYALFALAALLPWCYFAEALRRSSVGLVEDAELIRKVYFPRLVLPAAAVIAPVVDFVVSLLVFAAMMAWYRVAPTDRLLLLPLFLVMTVAWSFAVGLWLGPLNTRYRDVKHMLPFVIQIWMYASPVVYPLSIVPQHWRLLYSLNPMVGIIEGFRWSLLGTSTPQLAAVSLSAAITSALLAGGLLSFKRAERHFADVI